MGTLNLIVTLVLFALLLYGIKKKINLATLLFFVSMLGLIYMTLTGTTLLEDASSGSRFLDIFEYIYNQMKTGIAGTVLTVLLIFGYLEIMTKIHATDTLATKASHLLSGIKNPYLLASLAIILGAFLKIGITVGPNIAMMMVATLYPVLIASGCTRKTAASAMHTYCFMTWGPADTANYTGLSLIFVLIFSSLICKTVIISVVGAVLLSTCIAVLAYLLHKKSFTEGVSLFTELYNGMGNGLKGLGVVILFGTIFAGIMGKIGGMKEIVSLLTTMHLPALAFVILLSLLSFVITWVIGTFLGAISMCIPLASTIAAATGMSPTGLLHLTLMACGCGVTLSPIQSGNIVVASATGLETMDIVKRNAIPITGALVATLVVSLLFFL